MILPSTKEIILRLKEEKEKNDYSVPQIQKMCWDNGLFMCLNTVRNIFANGSEDNSFSYEHTIRPIANVMLSKGKKVPSGQTEILERQLELLTNQIESDRREHKRYTDLLNQRIQVQAKKIAEQEQLIKELLINQQNHETKN